MKEGLLPLLSEAKTLDGHRFWIEFWNELKLEVNVENCVSFSKSHHSFHLELWSNRGVCSKFDFEIGVADLEFGVWSCSLEFGVVVWSLESREKFWSLERSFGVCREVLEFAKKF